MHHYFEAITNTSGDSLIGYFARVVDPATNNGVTIAADNNGTPISTVSGVDNAAKTDAYGNLDFYVEPGTYHLDIYAPNATSLQLRVQNVAMNSTKGDTGEPGPPGSPGQDGAPGAPGVNPESIGLFAAGMRPNIDNGTTRVRTSGATRGDFIYDSTLSETDRAAYPLAMFRDFAGRVFRRDPRDLWIEQFGAQPSVPGVFDSAPAIRSALAYMVFSGQGDAATYPSLRSAPRIRVGIGRFQLASRVLIACSCQIIGEGGGVEGSQAATIFECAESGLVLDRYNTTNGQVVTPTHYGADGTLIQGIYFRSLQSAQPKTANGNFAIRANCRVKIIDVMVTNFPSQGIFVYGTSNPTSPSDFVEGEASGCIFRNITVSANYTGIQLGSSGAEADVNVCSFEGVNTFGGNYKWGLDAQNFLCCSFMGSMHFKYNGQMVHYAGKRYQGVPGAEASYGSTQPGTKGNVWSYVEDGAGDAAIPTWANGGTYIGGGPVKHANPNAASVFVACYREEGQPRPWIMSPAISVGGQGWQLAAGCTGIHFSGSQGEAGVRSLRATLAGMASSAALNPSTGLEVSNGNLPAYFGPRYTGYRIGIGQGDGDTALFMRGINSGTGEIDVGFIEARKLIAAGPFADNAAAVAAGLVKGSIYRMTDGTVKAVV